jgi:polyhydroxyalkanoate synthase
MHGKPEEPSGKAVVNPEAFARNLARLMEEGGRAMAAYMKPREEGTVQDEVAEELTDVTKTLGKVAEYWMSDPQRAIVAQSSLVKGYLDLWNASMKRMAAKTWRRWRRPRPRTAASPIRNGRRIRSSTR